MCWLTRVVTLWPRCSAGLSTFHTIVAAATDGIAAANGQNFLALYTGASGTRKHFIGGAHGGACIVLLLYTPAEDGIITALRLRLWGHQRLRLREKGTPVQYSAVLSPGCRYVWCVRGCSSFDHLSNPPEGQPASAMQMQSIKLESATSFSFVWRRDAVCDQCCSNNIPCLSSSVFLSAKVVLDFEAISRNSPRWLFYTLY